MLVAMSNVRDMFQNVIDYNITICHLSLQHNMQGLVKQWSSPIFSISYIFSCIIFIALTFTFYFDIDINFS